MKNARNTLKHGQLNRRYWTMYAALGVVVVLFCMLRFYPILKLFYMSLFNWNMATGVTKFIGFKNFTRMFGNSTFLASLWRTIYMGLEILLITVPIGLVISNAINRKVLAKPFVQSGLFIPYIMPMVPTVIIWKWLFNTEYGLLNYGLSFLGIEKMSWLTNGNLAEWAIVIITVWKNLGYCVLILTVGLAGISKTYYEAAEIDGASGRTIFWRITLPLLKPVLIYVSIIMLIRGFNVYTQAYILCSDSSGSPGYVVRTLVYDMVENGFKFYKMGYASAEAVVLFLIIFLFSVVQFVFGDSDRLDNWRLARISKRGRTVRKERSNAND